MPDPQLRGYVCVDCGIAVRRCHQHHPMDPPGTECYVHVSPQDHDPVPVPRSAYLPPPELDFWVIRRPANWPLNWLDW